MARARLYDDNLYRFDVAQPSYWEATAVDADTGAAPLESDASCDVAVIGGGYTGLSAALHLARDHGIDTAVLEAGHIGWGASGRNGGFCCIGGTGLPRERLIRLAGPEHARAFYRASVDAVELVRSLLRDEAIDADPMGDAEFEVAHSPRAARALETGRDALVDALGIDAAWLPAADARQRLYDSPENFGALRIRPAFGLHPLRFCRGLAAAAKRHGASLFDHSEVLRWTRDDRGRHRLATRGATLRARRVVYACNGFMHEQLHPAFHGTTLPIISAILVTRRLSDSQRERQRWLLDDPAINSRHLLNYFRLLPDGRLLFGGRGLGSGDPVNESATYARLAAELQRQWPAWRDVEVDYRWQGLICATATLLPAVGRLAQDDSVFFAYGYHGNGVNMATWAGRQLAAWIAADARPAAVPAMLAGAPRRFPLPRLRRAMFRVGVALARWHDRR
ncbi:MAG: FAD-binding oxidoreductase [Woeseiaceae bacterium]|nr:FAD-binding oxidoreductase [Woeseiaceae bacterium]